MARYDVECYNCEHVEEIVRPYTDESPIVCSRCGGTARKIVSGFGARYQKESSRAHQEWFHSDATQAKLKSGELQVASKSSDIAHRA